MSRIIPSPLNESRVLYNEAASGRSFGVNAVLVMGALVIAMAGLQQISSVFGPVFFALTLVISFLPINRWMIRHRVPAAVAIFITIIILMSTMLFFVGIIVLSLWGLPGLIASYRTQINDIYVDTYTWALHLAQQFNIDPSKITGLFKEINATRIIDVVSSVASSFTSVSSAILTLLLAMFFLVIDTSNPEQSSQLRGEPAGLGKALRHFERAVRQYWIVTTVFGLVVAALCSLALMWIKVPGAITWGVVAFVTNYIPNLGFILGVIPPMLVGLLAGGWHTALYVLLAYSVLNFVIQSMIQPKVTGDAVGLNTSTAFLSLLVWSIVIGPLGAILAIPLTLFFKALLIDSDENAAWLNRYLQSPSALRKQHLLETANEQQSLLQELGFQWQSSSNNGEIKERFRTSEMRLRGRVGKKGAGRTKSGRVIAPDLSSEQKVQVKEGDEQNSPVHFAEKSNNRSNKPVLQQPIVVRQEGQTDNKQWPVIKDN